MLSLAVPGDWATMNRRASVFLVLGLVMVGGSAVQLGSLLLRDPGPSLFMKRHLALAGWAGVSVGVIFVVAAFGLRAGRPWARRVLRPVCWVGLFAVPIAVVEWLWGFVPSLWDSATPDHWAVVLIPGALAVCVVLAIASGAWAWLLSAARDLGNQPRCDCPKSER